MFYKICKNGSPLYLLKLILEKASYVKINVDVFCLSKLNITFTKTLSSHLQLLNKWNKLDPTIRKAESFGIIESNLLKLIRPISKSVLTVTATKELE